MSQHQHDDDDPSPPELVRWSEERAQTGMAGRDSASFSSDPDEKLERKVGALFRSLPDPPPFGPVAQSRVLARLRAPGRRPRFRPLVMGWSLGAVLWSLSGAVIAAGGVGTWWKLAHPKPAEVAPAPPRAEAGAVNARIGSGQRRPARRPLLAPDTTVQEAPQPTQVDAPEGQAGPPVAPAPQEVSPSAVVPHASPAASVRPPALLALVDKPRISRTPTAAVSGLGQETRVLANAMANLRRDEDAGAALVALDSYLRQFPNGMLIDEARRARVDALLMLDRKDDARRALDELDLEPEGRGLELRLIRGELRARNSCSQATRDFDAVLLHVVPPQLAERALFGRAVCRNRQGQDQAAREDARNYLERFPAGRFATAVRRIAGGASLPAP